MARDADTAEFPAQNVLGRSQLMSPAVISYSGNDAHCRLVLARPSRDHADC